METIVPVLQGVAVFLILSIIGVFITDKKNHG